MTPSAERRSALLTEARRFLSVGAMAYVVDVVVFNLLRPSGPLAAKAASTALGVTFAYLANRRWTYGHRPRNRSARREYAAFVLVNAACMALAVGALVVSRNVLHLQGVIADNVSANVVGVGLGTAVRFLAYRHWVFPDSPAATPRAQG